MVECRGMHDYSEVRVTARHRLGPRPDAITLGSPDAELLHAGLERGGFQAQYLGGPLRSPYSPSRPDQDLSDVVGLDTPYCVR